MWRYEQATGKFFDPDGNLLGIGYSGRQPDGKNKPEMQSVPDVGPIPQGQYRIGGAVDTLTHGPYVLPLSPNIGNQMFGRAGFLIHGDSVVNPGSASEGCIILPLTIRQQVGSSFDDQLQVVIGIPLT